MAGNDAINSYGGVQVERTEGELYASDLLSLGMTDDETARAIGNRVELAEAWWNKELDLDKKREMNEKYYLGTYLEEDKLYDFQVPYKDNRIFNSIETLIPMALGNPAQPIVTEAYDTPASRELAQNHGKWLLGKYQDLYLNRKFEMVARHLLMGMRIAWMKYRWDTTIGQLQKDGTRFGDVAVDVLRPQKVVIDAGANDPEDIPLIGEFQTETVEGLCYKFPQKKDQIMRELGFQRGVSSQMNKRVGYIETWFTYYDKKTGAKMEGLAWKMKTLVLKGIKNPNWNYDEVQTNRDGTKEFTNFFDRPRKPYVPFTHLGTGKYIIDDTSIAEQAHPLQAVLDKRGRQLVENADQANAGTIFNSDQVSPENVAKLIGDPGEKIMSKGDVQKAAMRLPINMLPPYVLEDKYDIRNEIDEIFGTHSIMVNGRMAARTLGQEVMAQRADVSRTKPLGTAIENGADLLYKGLTQMAKVFYDEPQLQRFTNPLSQGGGSQFVEYSRDQIQPGMQIRVQAGSVMPDDPAAKEQQTVQMMAILDPLSIAEGIGKEDPIEFAKRLIYFRMFPDRYLTEVLQIDPNGNNGQDPSAVNEDAMLLNGQNVPPQQNPTKEHLATHQAFLQSPEFQQAPPMIQQKIIHFVEVENANAKSALGMDNTAPGQPQEQENNIQTGEAANQPGQQPPPQAPVQNAGTPPPQGGMMSRIAQFFGR